MKAAYTKKQDIKDTVFMKHSGSRSNLVSFIKILKGGQNTLSNFKAFLQFKCKLWKYSCSLCDALLVSVNSQRMKTA